ncbi:hypothetical protein DEU56DRAFT_813785 [Suillus clintonianus]|uniref:uncharacterized protein n=1 Tax=Suillus clintonianus TaxID=1904413 RepID=UPI001B87A7EE|nr:uncharacterized protein DEU56DRAFT_813785 [Suillus clintonianus]KAG2131672.1 hypothetical protein DEU56DRAFT_813785 [Suillus clintonianus]
MLIQVIAHHSQWFVSVLILGRARAMLIQAIAHRSQVLSTAQRKEMGSRLLTVVCDVAMNLLIIDHVAAVIIFEHSFYIFDKRRYLRGQQQSVPYSFDALEQYMASPHAAAVREAVSTAARKYQEAVSAVKNKPSTWKAKLPFERSQRKAQLSEMKAELMKTVLGITLEYRLPRP